MGIGDESETLESSKLEKKKIIDDEDKGVYADGLRCVNIKKCYRKLPFGLVSTKDVHAVKGIYLEVARNELLCLLGHNGAGKSTLFNMLTGIIGPTEGYAKICGYDIRYDQHNIRKIMGLVPQFDILWNQMTALEHMRMFSKIKGVRNDEIESSSIAC